MSGWNGVKPVETGFWGVSEWDTERLSFGQAKLVWLMAQGLLENVGMRNLEDLYKENPVKACRLALRRTAGIPENDRLEAIDRLLATYGTEAIRGDWQNGYWCDIVAAYCNTGDTYAVTVMQVRPLWSGGRSRFIVTSWGDWVERNQDRYGIA